MYLYICIFIYICIYIYIYIYVRLQVNRSGPVRRAGCEALRGLYRSLRTTTGRFAPRGGVSPAWSYCRVLGGRCFLSARHLCTVGCLTRGSSVKIPRLSTTSPTCPPTSDRAPDLIPNI